MNRAIIGIGSNIDPSIHVQEAFRRLDANFAILGRSDVIRTKAIGREDLPDFLNAVVAVDTELDLHALDRTLKRLEAAMGRTRGHDRFASRTIDLDILVFNGRVVDEDVAKRPFLRDLIRQVWAEFDYEGIGARE